MELGLKMERLGTKAETLEIMYGKLNTAKVLPQFTFTVSEWAQKKEEILYQFLELEWNANVIVRSSCQNEDTQDASMAGKFESVADVCGVEAFQDAVSRVIHSYGADYGDDQILVQPMLREVKFCGVAFTLDPSTHGNYYVINYDATGDTSAVTSGTGDKDCLYYHFKNAPKESAPEELRQLLAGLEELEIFFGQDNLDVEFAITQENELYILQVRALCISQERIDQKKQAEELTRITEKIKQNNQSKPFLCGQKTAYSVMTDWNPAEMIGVRPKPLALSLYKEIITDSVWAYQRDNYGYRNLRSFPLMVDFCGLPYIDVRVSFNSFIPAGLDEEISEKLVNYYIGQLVQNPQKHDKAEFEIVFSCYTLDMPQRIQILKEYGFSEEEIGRIIDALRNVTNHIIDYKNGLWRKDYRKIEILNQRYQKIMESELNDIEKIYWLLEDCKRYGTLPFAGLARAAFIAVQILKSFVACGILCDTDYEAFMGEVDTVSSAMNRDREELSAASFLKKYGHLRPGTYDITSLRYDEAPELYFNHTADDCMEKAGNSDCKAGQQGKFRLSLEQLNQLRDALQENGLTNNVLDIMDFIKNVIKGREYGKFVFTRNLSMAIRLISQVGNAMGVSRDECSYIGIQTIYDLYVSTGDIKERFLLSIQQGKKKYEMTQAVTLPPVILNVNDVESFYYPDSEPNFITSLKVCGEVKVIESMVDTNDISGKVVLIESADPGYDWIFALGIKGLITMYGGANSHMAIRAGELGVPAVIGVGVKRFEKYRQAHVVEIDALLKTIRVLK
ncbi:MAG: phosphoenolpyruvate synthase [Lachnospiraceae bacterium]|nr:phosphoenolpyruvate synthase [Lachnospiraceae bacterium]